MGQVLGYQTTRPPTGVTSIFNTITSAPERVLTKGEQAVDTGKYIMIVAVVGGAGVLLMLAYSFASGKQNLAATVQGVGDIAMNVTPAGRASKLL